MRARRKSLFLVWFVVLLQVSACEAQPQVTIATEGGRQLTFQVEVADTPAKRELGLQYRRDLALDRGMIFLFPAESGHSFWMKNTPIPLDIIFISKDRKIVGIVEQAVPFSTESRSVPGASQFVLEINGGLSERYGIKAGDTVQFHGLSPEGIRQ